MAGRHFIYKCKHGEIVIQCRCPECIVTIVPCPSWCKSAMSDKPYDWETDGE